MSLLRTLVFLLVSPCPAYIFFSACGIHIKRVCWHFTSNQIYSSSSCLLHLLLHFLTFSLSQWHLPKIPQHYWSRCFQCRESSRVSLPVIYFLSFISTIYTTFSPLSRSHPPIFLLSPPSLHHPSLLSSYCTVSLARARGGRCASGDRDRSRSIARIVRVAETRRASRPCLFPAVSCRTLSPLVTVTNRRDPSCKLASMVIIGIWMANVVLGSSIIGSPVPGK